MITTTFSEHPSSLIYIKLKKQIIFCNENSGFTLLITFMYVVYRIFHIYCKEMGNICRYF